MAKAKKEAPVGAVDDRKLYSQADFFGDVMGLQKIMDNASKSQGLYNVALNSSLMRRNAISTGSLALDLIMGGGHLPGRFTYFYGPTGSGKSTLMFQSLIEPIQKGSRVMFYDFEASLDPEYLIKLGVNIEEISGFQNKKGEWTRPPLVSYLQPHTAQQHFIHMREILTKLWDKITMMDGEEPRFFMINPEFKNFQPSWRHINEGLKSKKVFEVENGFPQVIFIEDSINAMTPEAQIDRYGSESPALLAKALGDGYRMIKSLLGSKNCNLLATNLMKVNPMARMSNPETEIGGTAVQGFPDVRVKLTTNRGQSSMIEEDNVTGEGIDRYMKGTAFMHKNKGGLFNRKMPYRIWVDELGVPKGGIDPVFDAFKFMNETGQLVAGSTKEDKDKFKITIKGFDDEWLTISQFKNFVLTNSLYHELREALREQLRSGEAQTMYADITKNRPTNHKVDFTFKVGISHEVEDASDREVLSFDSSDDVSVIEI